MSRTKIIRLDERFAYTGEPTVQPVILWGPRNRPCYEQLSKEASVSPARDYIQSITPVPGRTIILVIGLGSFEYYGLNRNGDGFNERPYKVGQQPTCGCCAGKNRDAWVLEEECIQHHYKSYEQGHVYLHHCNSNPKRAVGKVLKAFWNSYMHRIEVLEDLDNAKAPEIVQRIADGECPAKSMGTRIKFDVCAFCGHMSPTRAQYCDHLKWEMGQLDPKTGIRYGALNPSPRFFDSSWVVRPADRTGYMLKKVATAYELADWDSNKAGELVEHLQAKAAAAHKLAVIDKVVRGYPAAIVQSELPEAPLIEKYRKTALPDTVARTPELSTPSLQGLSLHQLPALLAALSRAGIILTTPEFIQLFVNKALPGVVIPETALDNLTALQTEFFELLSQRPSLLDELIQVLTPNDEIESPALHAAIAPLLEKRSTASEYLQRRVIPQMYRHDEPPSTELLHVSDPQTGRLFQTNRGAVRAAQDAVTESQIAKILGSGGLLAAAYKTMQLPGKSALLSVPLGLGGAALSYHGLKGGPQYETTTGERIPHITELREKRSSLMDVATALGMDYGTTKTANLRLDRVYQRITQTHPLYPFLQKTATWNLLGTATSLASQAVHYEKAASDGLREPLLDLDKLAHMVGTLVLEVP